MDERYWIINDSLHALRNMAMPHLRQLELEVKLLTLRVELLRQDGNLGAFKDVPAFENLKLLVRDFVTDGASRQRCSEISQCIDTISTALRERAAESCHDH